MYCRKCGNKLEDDALFCPECGTKVDREGMDQDVNSNADAPHYQNAASGQNNMGAGNATGDNNNEKINWREYLTMENIERFAPIAALLPIGMAVVVSVLGLFLFNTLGVRRHIVGGANRTFFSVDLPPRLCRTGTCRRLQTE